MSKYKVGTLVMFTASTMQYHYLDRTPYQIYKVTQTTNIGNMRISHNYCKDRGTMGNIEYWENVCEIKIVKPLKKEFND